jgi:hypothetical protein
MTARTGGWDATFQKHETGRIEEENVPDGRNGAKGKSHPVREFKEQKKIELKLSQLTKRIP